MLRTEVRFLHYFLLLYSVVQRYKVLRQLLSLEGLGETSATYRAKGQLLLLYLNETLLAEGVATSEVARAALLVVKYFVTGWALHLLI
jgi:hypothetical protein